MTRSILKNFLVLSLAFIVSQVALAGPIKVKDIKRSKFAWFYNKPDATIETLNRDEYNCTAFGHHMFTVSPYNDGDPYVEHSGIVGSLIGGAVSSGPIRATKDDCMMSLGYRRFNTFDKNLKTFRKRLEILSKEEQLKYYNAPNPPEGKLTRQWVNTFWLTTTDKQTLDVEARNYMPVRDQVSKDWEPKWDILKPSKNMPVVIPDANEAILIVKIKPTENKPAGIVFARVNPKTGNPSPTLNKKDKLRQVVFGISENAISIKDYAVFKVPAGSYALAKIKFHSMCMQTVVFHVESTEVIYLGEYTGRKNDTQVHALAPTPKIRFRFDNLKIDKVARDLDLTVNPKPVQYYNNFPYQCPTTINEKIYGISMPGKPTYQYDGKYHKN